MLVLGLNCAFSASDEDFVPNLMRAWHHDASACIVLNGEVVAAVEEERFNRIKHTTKFATSAIRYCLEQAGVKLADVDVIAFFQEEGHIDKMLGREYVRHSQAIVTSTRDHLLNFLEAEFQYRTPADNLTFVQHHTAHAVGTHRHSGFDDALVVVMDGNGERDSTTVFHGSKSGLRTLSTFPESSSLGHMYTRATELLGYHLFDEYKVMGLAPYGDPKHYRSVFDSLYTLSPGGQFKVDWMSLQDVFLQAGFLPRRRGATVTQDHMDLAAGMQETLERIVLHLLAHWRRETGLSRLCLAGGVAHNCSVNGKILRSGIFEEVFVHPASHDAGAALGAALAICGEHAPVPRTRLRDVFWGPQAANSMTMEAELRRWSGLIEFELSEDIVSDAALLLSTGNVLGWVQGRSEFGPRALGNRSILADPRPRENQARINAMVKKRESFRPFAPVVAAEAVNAYFEVPPSAPDLDFMSFALRVRDEAAAGLGAVTHVDQTARVQVADKTVNPRLWSLVTRFGEITGTPVLLNTSFNNNAEPIVQSLRDAVTCFLTTDLDYLVVEDFLIAKRDAGPRNLLQLYPTLVPTARLLVTTKITAAGVAEHTREILFNYDGGKSTPISEAIYRALARCDGRTTFAGLLEPDELTAETAQEALHLWEERYIVMSPPA